MPYWRLFYHFAWATHERLPLIQPSFEMRLFKTIAGKANRLGAIVHAVGGVEDHVHLAVSIPPSVKLSTFIGQVKGASSHFVTQVFQTDFQWQAEYGVVSLGESQLDRVIRYIGNQRAHHQEGSVIAGLECCQDGARGLGDA